MSLPTDTSLADFISPPIQTARTILRQKLIDATRLATGHDPYDWQVEIAEALCEKRDVLCIAGTGSGKTLAFVMPCFVDPRALIWIVSPLNYIEQQQMKVFRKWGIRAISVNAVTSYPGLHKDILSGQYQVIITSPEQLLEYNKLRPIVIQLGSQNWNNIVVVDECHCICIWSDEFRKMYGLIGTLRIFLLPGTPFCAATATATNSMQKQIRSSLRFSDNYLFVNRGYWKPNLSWHVYYMAGSDTSISELTCLFPKDLGSFSILPMSIIFVDERSLAFKIMRVIRNLLPPALLEQVEVYHALQSTITKDRTAQRFEAGEIRILICTEALTMGCDFRKIEQVILFKVPSTLPTLLQRGGRGGRDPSIWCRVVLMVEASKYDATQVKSKSKGGRKHSNRFKIEKQEDVGLGLPDQENTQIIGVDDVDNPGQSDEEDNDNATRAALTIVSAEHGKEDELFLQQFYKPTDSCRTLVLDTAFCSPPHPLCASVNGCDNCIRQQIRQLQAEEEKQVHLGDTQVKREPIDKEETLGGTIERLRSLLVEERSEEKQPQVAKRNKYRLVDERSELEEIILLWRSSVYEADCKRLGIHADYIITNKTITSICRVAPPVTLETLSTITPPWPEKALARWGKSLLLILQDFDSPAHVASRRAHYAALKQEKRRLQASQPDVTEPKTPASAHGKVKQSPHLGEVVSHIMKKRNIRPGQSLAELTSSSSAQAQCYTPDLSPQPKAVPSREHLSPNQGLVHSQNLLLNPSQDARPVSTIRIQAKQPTGTQITSPATNHSHNSVPSSSTVKNPNARREYYKDHLWQ